jgi:hypothetical protein
MSVDAPRTSLAGLREWAGRRFRIPGADDPPPTARHLARICVWAAALGLGGMLVALRAFVGLIYENRVWFLPTLIVIGVIGLVATIAAFASVHQRRLPMIMLGVASAALITAWFVTGL